MNTTSRPAQKMPWTTRGNFGNLLQRMAQAQSVEAERIGKLIAQLRLRQGMSQEDLARKLHISVSTISRWERGMHAGYGSNIRKLAQALDVEPAILTPATDVGMESQLDRIEGLLTELLERLVAAEVIEAVAKDRPPSLRPAGGSRRRRAG